MPKCKRCNEEIEFLPHPTSGKLTPFSNGEIHFSVCKAEKDGFTSTTPIVEMTCPTCLTPAKFIYWGKVAGPNPDRLRLAFDCAHKGIFLSKVEKNIRAVNTTEKKYLEAVIATGKDKWGDFRQRLTKLVESESKQDII